MINIWDSDSFTTRALTDAVNVIPNMYGRMQELGVFPPKPVNNRLLAIEQRDGVLNLLPFVTPGGPATLGTSGKRKTIPLEVPHVPHEDIVRAEEVAGVRAFGSENRLETVGQKVAEKLADMRSKHAITLEFLRSGALRGLILDPRDGSTHIDLFTTFNVTEQVEDFAFTTAATKVRHLALAVKRKIEDKLKGEVMREVRAVCSEQFFDALIDHKSVAEAYAN